MTDNPNEHAEAYLARALQRLGHDDPRCGYIGPAAIRVFCPACQPDGARYAGDEPHLIIAATPDGPDEDCDEHVALARMRAGGAA